MTFCIVEFLTQSATFRHPDFQNFHKTLLLPPPSTLIGLAGAAMGLTYKQSQDFFYENDISIGIYGSSNGYTKDLWKFRTKDEKKPLSIISKEILVKNHFIVVYGCENKNITEKIKKAFSNPIYALTLGNSDSIAKITPKTPLIIND
jgi:CRISPR-associated protein Cas5t